MSVILVTGASRGIGRELAARAVARGDTVFAVVRQEKDLSALGAHPNLKVVRMDIRDTVSVEAGFAAVDQLLNGGRLDAVIHSAAIAKPNTLEVGTVEEFAETLDTNTLGTLRVLKAALPRLRGGGGRLILMTSLWGKTSGAMVGSYSASKHAIESIADCARRETAGMGVDIVVVEPGVVKTEMLTGMSDTTEGLLARMPEQHRLLYGNLYRRYARLTQSSTRAAITAAQCSEAIERILKVRRPRTRYKVGLDSRIVCLLAWLLPDRWMDALMGLSLNNKPLKSAD
ncbi:MAG TPA: SDR family NAD(P)-dependent oxidoreductase [Steroidobacteraceae bacterium]|nr:SDR family NAD(P)-dependent oxidoreductase [Steroidobacteraceae bacterium]